MAIYRGHTITNRGRQLLAKVMAGQGEFEVSAVKFGSGRFEGNQREVTDLVNEKISLELINIRNEGAMAVVTARLTNENLLESFRAEELGIFAKLKGTNEEVLYAYTLALESDVIPDNSLGATLIIDLNIYMELSDSVDAVMTINESRVFLTLEHAKEIFSQTGLLYSGELLNMGSLQENKVYKANDGKYYKNTGGNRVWNGTGEIDDKFKEVTWERLNQDILALAIEDGKNMAKILGVEDYGGILNTSDLKKAGWAYYCTQNKYIYECLSDTRLNYADAEFFEPLSNKSLLGKFKNLIISEGFNIKLSDIRLSVQAITISQAGTTVIYNKPFKRIISVWLQPSNNTLGYTDVTNIRNDSCICRTSLGTQSVLVHMIGVD
ncbi:MAG: hypothetical protein ACRCYA_08405 [Cetobacterium sp.]|uniref:hypothetical protein n=1 Tax=Cetobacterium sp. TaxID=2071632 RepID=UPI003F401F12